MSVWLTKFDKIKRSCQSAQSGSKMTQYRKIETSSNSKKFGLWLKLFAYRFIWYTIFHDGTKSFHWNHQKQLFSATCFQIWAFQVTNGLYCLGLSWSKLTNRLLVKSVGWRGHSWCRLKKLQAKLEGGGGKHFHMD